MRPPASIVEFLVRSLDGAAPGWEFDGYRAVHAGLRAEIWIANEHYDMHCHIGGARYSDDICLFGFLVPWRRRLYRACVKAAERRVLASLNAYRGPADVAAAEQAVISDDTVFGWAQEFVGPEPDTDTIVLDGRLWRVVRRVGGATVVEGATRRLIEVEEV